MVFCLIDCPKGGQTATRSGERLMLASHRLPEGVAVDAFARPPLPMEINRRIAEDMRHRLPRARYSRWLRDAESNSSTNDTVPSMRRRAEARKRSQYCHRALTIGLIGSRNDRHV